MALGKSLAEISCISQDELNTWVAYVEENGPLSTPLRIDAAIARAVTPFLRNAKPRDLMPWPKEPEPEATPEALFLKFKNLAARTKERS